VTVSEDVWKEGIIGAAIGFEVLGNDIELICITGGAGCSCGALKASVEVEFAKGGELWRIGLIGRTGTGVVNGASLTMACGGGFGGVNEIPGAWENVPKESFRVANGLDAGAAGTLKAEVPLTFGGG
jgi:hypothetical protein